MKIRSPDNKKSRISSKLKLSNIESIFNMKPKQKKRKNFDVEISDNEKINDSYENIIERILNDEKTNEPKTSKNKKNAINNNKNQKIYKNLNSPKKKRQTKFNKQSIY